MSRGVTCRITSPDYMGLSPFLKNDTRKAIAVFVDVLKMVVVCLFSRDI